MSQEEYNPVLYLRYLQYTKCKWWEFGKKKRLWAEIEKIKAEQ